MAKVQREPKIASGDELHREMYPSAASGDLRDVVLEDIEDDNVLRQRRDQTKLQSAQQALDSVIIGYKKSSLRLQATRMPDLYTV